MAMVAKEGYSHPYYGIWNVNPTKTKLIMFTTKKKITLGNDPQPKLRALAIG